MLLTDMVINPIDATLQQSKEALNAISRDADAVLIPSAFVHEMIHGIVLAAPESTLECRGAIRHHVGIFVNHCVHYISQVLSGHALHV